MEPKPAAAPAGQAAAPAAPAAPASQAASPTQARHQSGLPTPHEPAPATSGRGVWQYAM